MSLTSGSVTISYVILISSAGNFVHQNYVAEELTRMATLKGVIWFGVYFVCLLKREGQVFLTVVVGPLVEALSKRNLNQDPRAFCDMSSVMHALYCHVIFDVKFHCFNVIILQQDKFQDMSDQIINRIDEMGARIDDLEKNIGEMMTQAGVDEPEK